MPCADILKYMLQYQPGPLDLAFHALADPARRAIVERLCFGPASVSDLAKPLPMSLSAVGQHLKVLQEARLVRTAKVGRVRTCTLDERVMAEVENWIADRKRFWLQQYDQLEAYLAQTASEEEQ